MGQKMQLCRPLIISNKHQLCSRQCLENGSEVNEQESQRNPMSDHNVQMAWVWVEKNAKEF